MILVQIAIVLLTATVVLVAGGDTAPVACGAAFFGGCMFEMVGAMRRIDRRPPR